LDCETAILDERLVQRTEAMFDAGLVDEVSALLDEGLREGVTASRALGYAQVIAALDAGGEPQRMREAQEQTFVGTRRYVRRQRSWFRRDHRVHWLDAGPADPENRARIVDAALQAWREVP
jgi:tRNA dimethylallyltransferase